MATRGMRAAFVLASLAMLLTPKLAEACTASSGGRRSFDIQVNDAWAYHAMCDLTLYEGSSCEADHTVGTTVGSCWGDELAVTDEGVFIAILSPRIARRNWDIVSVFTVGDEARRVALRLVDLPTTEELTGTVRVLLAPDGVLFRDRRREVLVPFATLSTARRTD